MSSVPSSRIPSLDGLRALSILIVLFGHASGTRNFPVRDIILPSYYANAAVRVFFVISGFLITTLLLREREKTGAIRLKNFYLRRAYRILPAAYTYMLVAAAVFYMTLRPIELALAFTYLSSYVLHPSWVMGHLWSLSVEEQFYLIWPAAMAVSTVFARRLALCTIVIDPVLRMALATAGRPQGTYFFFPLVADALASGCLLALFQPALEKYRGFFQWRGFLLIWGLTFTLPLIARPHARAYLFAGMPILHLGIALCIQNAIVMRYRLLNATVPVWIGTISYSLYLWQEPWFNPYYRTWFTAFPVNLMLAFLAAIASYYGVERPMLWLRDRRVPTAASSEPRRLSSSGTPPLA
jgi:peptidoglycan/LPS O-acetylase OafA/YrhL